MTIGALFSVAAPHQTHTQFYKRDLPSRNPWYQKQCSATVTCPPPPSRLIFTLCSPSSTALVEDGPSSSDALAVQSEPTAKDTTEIPQSGCKACGREEMERGCNGEGRIQGGIATIPGFGWWPIKAYRPCPGFVASGGRYRRQGQSMDEVAFGRGGETASVGTGSGVQSGKQSPRKSKR